MEYSISFFFIIVFHNQDDPIQFYLMILLNTDI